MKQFYFVRHGQSRDNAAHIWSAPNSPLTDAGRQQALQTAKQIKDQSLNFDVIIVSTLPRAQETARIIAAELGYPLDKLVSHDLFVERSWGDLTGQPNEMYQDPPKRKLIDLAPNAELLANLQARAARGLTVIKARPEEIVLLVGHGTHARALRRVIANEPPENEYLPGKRYENAEIARLL